MDKEALQQLLEKARYFEFPIQVTEIEDRTEDAFAQAFSEAFLKQAAPSPVVEGKPRMLQISAWMCHAEVANRNGDGFRLEDLQKAVEAGLFVPPFFGMVDFNHDFEAYGAWYEAKLSQDPRNGQWGILIKGAIFAWRYNELADKLLAMQQRNGFIQVSMACIPKYIEEANDSLGNKCAFLREPVFFTTSVLDVPPADPDADGLGSEDPDSSPEERERELLRANREIIDFASFNAKSEWVFDISLLKDESMEDQMDRDELLRVLKEAFGEVTGEPLQRIEDLLRKAEKLVEVETSLADVSTKLEEANNELTTTKERVVALEGELNTANLALETAKNELKDAESNFATLEEEVKSLREFKADVETKAAEAAREKRLNDRIAELPATAKKALEALEKAEELKAEIAEMSDEKWELLKATLKLGKSYKDRSDEEGSFGAGGLTIEEGGNKIDKYFENK